MVVDVDANVDVVVFDDDNICSHCNATFVFKKRFVDHPMLLCMYVDEGAVVE